MWKLLNILYRITSYVLFLAILLGGSFKFLTFFFFHDYWINHRNNYFSYRKDDNAFFHSNHVSCHSYATIKIGS